MFQFGKIISESLKLAFNELRNNPLRSILTLLGIYIGIFCIISIQTAVDWLNGSIDDSINSLGTNTVYVQKFPWSFSENYPWWEYVKRPVIDYDNYQALKDNLNTAESVGFFSQLPSSNVKKGKYAVNNVSLYGTTSESEDAGTIKLKYGRFFNAAEERGSAVAVIGEKISKELFGENVDPVDLDFRINGKKFKVIGMIAEDDNLIGFLQWDEGIIIPHYVSLGMFSKSSMRYADQWVTVKAKESVSIDELRDDIRGVMRGSRKLRPIQDDNFAINRITSILEAVKGTKDTLNVTGIFLGIFSLLIGGFGVANIMFVSVRERTKYIGLKKALGAKKWVIMSEFLIESIILCIIGSLAALGSLWLIILAVSNSLNVDFVLSLKNIIWGVGIATVIGLISGLIPAIIAANMDPVKAIRS